MKLAPGIGAVAITFALGLVGLFAHGAWGDVAGVVWLGVFPGMALVRLLLPGAPMLTRWTLGVALSPLAASVVGWALLRSGQPATDAARLVGLGGWLLFAGGEARALLQRARADADAPSDRVAWAWAAAAAAFVAIPVLASPYMLVRSDSWVHVGIVWEILERGIPPQDPRFAGLSLNYVWFYNLYLALASSVRGEPQPFVTIAVSNVLWMASSVGVVWQLAWAVWRDRAAARGALPLYLVGLNAGALLLWPLWLVRALRGEVRGLEEVQRILAGGVWNRTEVVRELCAPFALLVNHWDKFTVGTALGYAYLLLLVWWWAAVRWFGDVREPRPEGTPPAWRWLVVAASTAAGMMLFHSVVGLSALPVGILGCAGLAALAGTRWRLVDARRALAFAGASAVGLALSLPYFLGILRGWQPERSGLHHQYLRLDWPLPWTLLTACGVVLGIAWPALRRVFAERRVAAMWLSFWTLGMTLFALVVHLPEWNESKFVWQVFAPLAILGGASLPAAWAAWCARLGRPGAALLAVILFALPSALFLRGYLLDERNRTAVETHPEPGERELHAWLRQHTAKDAVLLDHHSRDLLLVQAHRRLLAGHPHAAERAAFPREELARRRAVMADLYGEAGSLDADVALLAGLGAPAYIVYRASDFSAATPWAALDADSARFERVYDSERFRVYRRRP
jgi:hypothetical protein